MRTTKSTGGPQHGRFGRLLAGPGRRRRRQVAAMLGAATIASLGLVGEHLTTATAATPQQITYSCQPFPQYFSVPTGVTSLMYQAAGGTGAEGGYPTSSDPNGNSGGGPGGHGSQITGTIAVTPGDLLSITVGCPGLTATASGFAGQGLGGYGYDLGGPSGSTGHVGGGGGGSTGVIDTTNNTLLLTAGGGGGGGGFGFGIYDTGGSGGYAAGTDVLAGGGGGTGAGGAAPSEGTVSGDTGGTGVSVDPNSAGAAGSGGGGGGGFAGGIGGNAGGIGDGGGGGGAAGSDYAARNVVTKAPDNAPLQSGGYLSLSFSGAPAGVAPVTAGCNGGLLAQYTIPAGATGAMVTEIGASGGDVSGATDDDFSRNEGGNGAGVQGTLTEPAGTVLDYGVGCEGQDSPGNGHAGGYADFYNPGGAGGQGWTAGGTGGQSQRDPGDAASVGALGASGGGGSTGFDIDGFDTQLVAGGGGGAAPGFERGGAVASQGGGGGDAASGPGIGAAGGDGSAGTDGTSGGNLAGQAGNGDGGAGSYNTYDGDFVAGGGGGGGGPVDAGGGGGQTDTDQSAYGQTGGGGGGGGSFTGGSNISDVSYFDTTAWRALGASQETDTYPDRDGTIIIVPLYSAVTTPPGGVAPTITDVTPDVVGYTDQTYTNLFTVTGTPYPRTTVTSGVLPPGLSLTDPQGDPEITGTPTAGGTYHVTLTAANGVDPSASVAVTIVVDSPPTITGTPPLGQMAQPYPSYQFTLGGSPTPTAALAGGNLPPGLVLSPTGLLTGTPTVAGSYPVQLMVTNGDGTGYENVTITINGVGPTAPLNVVGTANGVGTVDLTWSAPLSSGAAPLSLYEINGVDETTGQPIDQESGFPTTNPPTSATINNLNPGDTYSFTVTAENQDGKTGPASQPSAPVTTYVATSCQIVSASTPQGDPVTITIGGCAGTDVTYTVASQPSDGTLGPLSGDQITYTPNPDNVGNDTFNILATGAAGTAYQTVNVIIDPTATEATEPADEITATSARFNATLNDGDDSGSGYYFLYGTSDNVSQQTQTYSLPTSDSAQDVGDVIPGLAPSTTYYYRVVLLAGGQTYGVNDLQSFTTPGAGGGGGGTPPPSLPESPVPPLLLLGLLPPAAVFLIRKRRS